MALGLGVAFDPVLTVTGTVTPWTALGVEDDEEPEETVRGST
jgi:hypothetical protein